MTVEGVDYSSGRPGGPALAAAGKQFAVRYVPYAGDGGKGLTTGEIADLHGHGISIALVFESTSGRALTGHATGQADGKHSLDTAKALGFPISAPIYFAVDFNPAVIANEWAHAHNTSPAVELPAVYAAIDTYFDGVGSVLGIARTGVYGGLGVIRRLQRNGLARWFWQTYAWSGGVIDPGIHLFQYLNSQSIHGAAVDFDRAYQVNFGQWDGSPVMPPLPVPQEDPVILADLVYLQAVRGAVGKPLLKPDRTLIRPIRSTDPPFPRVGNTGDGFEVVRIPGDTAAYIADADATVIATPQPTPNCTQVVADAVAAQREHDRTAAITAITGAFA